MVLCSTLNSMRGPFTKPLRDGDYFPNVGEGLTIQPVRLSTVDFRANHSSTSGLFAEMGDRSPKTP